MDLIRSFPFNTDRAITNSHPLLFLVIIQNTHQWSGPEDI